MQKETLQEIAIENADKQLTALLHQLKERNDLVTTITVLSRIQDLLKFVEQSYEKSKHLKDVKFSKSIHPNYNTTENGY